MYVMPLLIFRTEQSRFKIVFVFQHSTNTLLLYIETDEIKSNEQRAFDIIVDKLKTLLLPKANLQNQSKTV